MTKTWAIALFAAFALPVYATQHQKPVEAAAQAVTSMSEGEVRRVDRSAKKITVRHGPLVNLDMPAMTMVFQVKDEAMLDQVKVGDKVKFLAEKSDGAFTITKIQPAP
jgi:Cu(I)/Ag(I) efflux system periplasmic protein CusF